MKRLFVPVGLIALALPGAAAVAAPTDADKREGARECRQLQRVVETRANFVQVVKLEARANSRNAFGRCVKVRTDDATSERNTAFKQAKEACASLRRTPGNRGRPAVPGKPAETGRPADPGAYGRCVAAAARVKDAAADVEQREETLNPARTCRAQQEDDAAAFKAKYPGRNGFGKCVSAVAKAQGEEESGARS